MTLGDIQAAPVATVYSAAYVETLKAQRAAALDAVADLSARLAVAEAQLAQAQTAQARPEPAP